jgi:putative ABC transport system permease protein
MSTDLILTGLLQGLILALVAYGIMIPFRLLNFPDLTAEGAYPLGGAVCASTLLAGAHPAAAIALSALAAGLMGVCTSLVHLRLKVNTLLAGIILATMVYSVNLQILRTPNVSLFDSEILFGQNSVTVNILILLGTITALIVPLGVFLHTEVGLRLRAVGLNPDFARRQSISVTKYTIFGLFLAGCYTGLAGSLMVQLQSYMDVGMGIGIVIHALAALMIGESIVGNSSLNRQLIAPAVGALIYQQIQGLALSLGLAPSNLRFLTGAIVLGVIAIGKRKT